MTVRQNSRKRVDEILTPRSDRYRAPVDARRRLLWFALVAYVAVGLLLALSPFNVFDREFTEFQLDAPVNLVMFMPPVALVLLLDRRIRPWWPVLAVAATSLAIEVVQKLSPRDSSWGDVVLNVGGAALAAGAVALGRSWHRARRLRP